MADPILDHPVLVKLTEIVGKQLPKLEVKNLDPSQELSVLGVDSLDFIEVIFEIETAFGIEIPNDRFEGIKTIQDLVTVVSDLISVTKGGETNG